MAISNPVQRDVSVDGAGSITSKTSASISTFALTAGRILGILALGAAGSTAFTSVTGSDTLANTGVWVNHGLVVGTNSNRYGTAISSCEVTGAPGTGTVTNGWTNASTRTVLSVLEVAADSPLQIVQTKTASGSASTQGATFDSAPGANSLVIVAANAATDADGITPDGATTELTDTSSGGGGNSRLHVAYRNGSSPPSSYTVSGLPSGASANNTIVIIELAEDSGPTVPDPPTIGTASAGNAQATVAFTDNDDGGSAITGHKVRVRKDGVVLSPDLTGYGTTSPLTITGLDNGADYAFAVIATNAEGDSSASSFSNTVAPLSPPSSGGGGGGARTMMGLGLGLVMGGGGGGGSAGIVLPPYLMKSRTNFPLADAGSWTATAGSVANNSTSGEFDPSTGSTQGIKITSDGTNSGTANQTMSANFDDIGQLAVSIFAHDAAGTVQFMLSSNTGFTDGFQWTLTTVLGKNTFLLRKSDATQAGTPEWTDTFIRLRVSYTAGATGRSITVSNFCHEIVGQTVYVPTLDDQHAGWLTDAIPALDARNMKGTFFISSDTVGAGGRISWSAINDIQDDGHTVGSHTDDHADTSAMTVQQCEDRIQAGIDDMVLNGLDSAAAHLFAKPFAPLPTANLMTAMANRSILLNRTGTGNVSFPSWDPYRIPCQLVARPPSGAAAVTDNLAIAKNTGRQLFTISHDIGPSGADPDDLTLAQWETVLDYCIAQQIPVITFQHYYRCVILGESVTIPRQW